MVRTILLFLPLCALLSACSPKITTTDAPFGTYFIDSPAEGLVTVRATGRGGSMAKAEQDAVKRAFETLIFRGLPDFTALSRPMIPNQDKFEASSPDFLANFLKDGTYERFVTTDYGPKEENANGGKQVAKEMTIDYANLRRYLENQGLTRKLGY